MGLFSRKKEKKPEQTPGGLVASGAVSTNAGEVISEDSAMRYAAVQACVRVLSEDIGALPLYLYRRTKDGGKERAVDHPLYPLLHDRPNADMTAVSFKEALMVNLLLTGNGYAFKEMDRAGRVIALYPLISSDVEPFRSKTDGRMYYKINGLTYDKTEIMHVVGLSYDGLVGMSPIAYARESIGLGMAAEHFGSLFFKNGTHVGGVIEVPGKMSDSAYERTAQEFGAMYRGLQKSHGIPILEEGSKFVKLSVDPHDAQFLDTRKYQRTEIAAIFRVPPHLIGDLERATFSNIEHQDISYLQRGLLPWLRRIEQTAQSSLLSEQERVDYVIEHDTASFLRGDTKSRYEAYAVGIQNGFISRNEVRVKENMNPVEGADELLQPLNMTEAGKSAEETGGDAETGETGKGLRGFRMADVDFTNDRRRRAVFGMRNAAGNLGLKDEQIEALRAAFSRWLARQAGDLIAIIERETGRRSKEDAQRLTEALNAYYETVAREGMPKDVEAAVKSVAGTAFKQVSGEVTAEESAGLDEEWMRGFYERYYDSMRGRLLGANLAEVERGIKDAGKEDIDGLIEKLRRWGGNRAENMAKIEAAWALNEGKLAAYRKCGYTGVWKSAPGCCRICTYWDGVPVTTVKPPLHKGCGCTVAKGERFRLTNEKPPDKITVNGVDYPTVFREGKQEEHILGTKGYKNRVKQCKDGKLPSVFLPGIDIRKLVEPEIGRHNPYDERGGGATEYFSTPYTIGIMHLADGGEKETDRVCIRYSAKSGWHAFPTNTTEMEQ